MVDENVVESVLETLRPGLDSDGFDLRCGGVSDGKVQVILEARPSACLDCLIPDDLMVMMIEDAIRQNDPTPVQVELVREGFDKVTADH